MTESRPLRRKLSCHPVNAGLELYNALIEAGIEKKRAERVAELVISRDEAKHLATKSDIADLRADFRVITARLNLLSALSVGIFVSVLATFVVA